MFPIHRFTPPVVEMVVGLNPRKELRSSHGMSTKPIAKTNVAQGAMYQARRRLS